MATQFNRIPATYLPGKHVHPDTSDLNPGDQGELRCFKCEAESQFAVGPRGGQRFGPWMKNGHRTPRCPKVVAGGGGQGRA